MGIHLVEIIKFLFSLSNGFGRKGFVRRMPHSSSGQRPWPAAAEGLDLEQFRRGLLPTRFRVATLEFLAGLLHREKTHNKRRKKDEIKAFLGIFSLVFFSAPICPRKKSIAGQTKRNDPFYG
jgi:hypothetical protein